jgi:DNA-directed RNA polymerase subunit M/transcription elongation factor TFIIS
MDFCEYCNNMYYFKHDEENKIIFYCKNCGAVKDIDDDEEAKQIEQMKSILNTSILILFTTTPFLM